MSSIDKDTENWPYQRFRRDDTLANDLHVAGNELMDGDPDTAGKMLDDLLARAPKFPSLSFFTKQELVTQKINFQRPLSPLEELFAHKNMNLNKGDYVSAVDQKAKK